MSLFEPGLPSVRQIQSFIKNKQKVEIGLITNNTFQGKILWQDHNCLCLVNQEREKTLVWLQGIIYIKPQALE
jgi:host factor-I protein